MQHHDKVVIRYKGPCRTNLSQIHVFNQFHQCLSTTLRELAFPRSYNKAKSALYEFGLGYETIHVCKFDRALFWGEHNDM